MASIARNEPCPCGSGKRYKHCHGVLTAQPAADAPAGDPMPLLREGAQLQAAGDLAGAAGLYRRALAIAPNHAETLNQLAINHHLRGEFGEAVACFKRAIDAEPGNAAFYNNCGESHRAAGQHAQAVARFESATVLAPASAEAWFNRGLSLHQLGRFADAEASLREAVRLAPDDFAAHLHSGHALREQHRLPEAADAYRAALVLRPGDYEGLIELAAALQQLGNMEEAGSVLARAHRAEPSSRYVLDRVIRDVPGAKSATAAMLLAAARKMPAARVAERAHIAGQLLRADLHDDYAASQAVVLDAGHGAIGPSRIRLETSSACNLRCQHCPTGVNYEGTDRSVMKPDLFEHVLEQMKNMPSLRSCVLYLGGEPLMNKHLVAMCQRVKRETSVTHTLITTNAMLLNEKWCAELATAMLDEILISVDGRSPEENDAIRVRASYHEIVKNVAMLRRHLEGTGTKLLISHSMFRRPQDTDTPEIPDFLLRDFPGIPVWSDYATRWPGFDMDKAALEGSELTTTKRRNFCDFPFFDVAVRANGEVVLCCHDLLGESVMGNVHHTPLAEIWNGPAYRELRRHMLNRDPERVHKVCQKCFVFTGERIAQKAQMDNGFPVPVVSA